MNFLKTFAATAAVVVAGTSVHAASWDFGEDARIFRSNAGYEGTFDQVYNSLDGAAAGTGGKATSDGITLSASASVHLSQEPAHPFMDSYSGGQPAGLGVCSSGFQANGVSECSSGSGSNTGDDNLMFPELLTLSFDRDVWLTSMFIRDAKHNVVEEGHITFAGAHPGGPLIVLEIIGGYVQDLASLGFKGEFTLSGAKGTPQLYIDELVADVPLPAAGWLMIAGLGGLVAARRKKS